MVIKDIFVNLHVHDAYGSLLDAIATPEEIVKWASENGQQAIAITNHGFMPTTIEQAKACKKYGVKPIFGVEAYEVDDIDFGRKAEEKQKNKEKVGKEKRYHLILLAKTQQGLENLYKMTSKACTVDAYVKPRISINELKENGLGKGIICLTACQAGRVSRLLVSDNENASKEVKEYYDLLDSVFDNTYIEIQSHGTASQAFANKRIMECVDEYNLPYVVTTDAHMIREDQRDAHTMFVAIGTEREAGESYQDCYLQTSDDIHRIMDKQMPKGVIDKAILTTKEIADMIDDNIDVGLDNPNMMPEIKIPEEFEKPIDYLRSLVYEEFDNKFGHMSKEEQDVRKDRIETELPVLDKVGYVGYFIMCTMLMKKAKEKGIPIGYARGSAGASICLFLLDVTQIDPVRWNLDFSRFANVGRTSMADKLMFQNIKMSGLAEMLRKIKLVNSIT